MCVCKRESAPEREEKKWRQITRGRGLNMDMRERERERERETDRQQLIYTF